MLIQGHSALHHTALQPQEVLTGVGYLGVVHPGLVDVIKHIICVPHCQPESANGVGQPQIVCNVARHLLNMPHDPIQLYLHVSE